MSSRLAWLSTVIVVGGFGALFIGAAMSPGDVWAGITGDDQAAARILWNIRLPRVVGAIVVGVALGIAGTGLQGVFRNPMADPYLLGVASSGGLGLAAVVGFGVALDSILGALATLGACLLVALLLRVLARRVSDGNGFVLVGVGMTLALLAWTLLVIFVADSPRLPTFTYFVFGGLGTANWAKVLVGAGLVLAATALMTVKSRELDLLALGDREAEALGLDVVGLRRVVLVGVAMATAGAVFIAGVVGFVALLATPLSLMLVGPKHRRLLVASGAVGALVVLAADTGIRTLPIPVEIPLGVITAAAGGPILVWLLLRGRFE